MHTSHSTHKCSTAIRHLYINSEKFVFFFFYDFSNFSTIFSATLYTTRLLQEVKVSKSFPLLNNFSKRCPFAKKKPNFRLERKKYSDKEIKTKIIESDQKIKNGGSMVARKRATLDWLDSRRRPKKGGKKYIMGQFSRRFLLCPWPPSLPLSLFPVPFPFCLRWHPSPCPTIAPTSV